MGLGALPEKVWLAVLAHWHEHCNHLYSQLYRLLCGHTSWLGYIYANCASHLNTPEANQACHHSADAETQAVHTQQFPIPSQSLCRRCTAVRRGGYHCCECPRHQDGGMRWVILSLWGPQGQYVMGHMGFDNNGRVYHHIFCDSCRVQG